MGDSNFYLAPISDEEDAEINAAIEADPEERERTRKEEAGLLRRVTAEERLTSPEFAGPEYAVQRGIARRQLAWRRKHGLA